MFLVVALFVIALLTLATAYDIRTREIPDWISIVIGTVGLMGSFMGWIVVDLEWMLLGGILGLAVGWALFRFAHFGGGDAKLIGAVGCVVGPIGVIIVLLAMAIAGGFLALVAIYRGQRDYAYAPAIMAGFLSYVVLISLI